MDKFGVILNEIEKRQYFYGKLHEQVKHKISDYLHFSIDKLLNNTDAVVFGGAVRDSIANLDIHDVDILALPRATQTIASQLSVRGFIHLRMSNADIIKMYDGIKIINEPWTFVKGDTIVQVIRPALGQFTDLRLKFKEILANVDISACGVAYRQGELFETFEDEDISPIKHCKEKVFVTLVDNIMHMSDRISHRKAKLFDRGWKETIRPIPEPEHFEDDNDLPF